MIQDINQHYDHQTYQKGKVTTPGTADSLIMHPHPTQFLSQSFGEEDLQKFKHTTLFTILQQRFQDKADIAEEEKVVKDQNKNTLVEDLDKCEFTIRIQVTDQNRDLIKSFAKTIIKTMENQTQITLIFDRQHEKIKIDTNKNYIISTFIETLDGFSRNIWEQTIILHEDYKKWSVMTLSNQDYSKCLNMEIEKYGKFFINPLSFKLPLTSISQFFDYKFKLLNKSQLLSNLKSITQLKGILHSLTKQNMGSRIIQKLLTKTNQKQIQSVINELKSCFKEMIFDRYGNYVFQKIFKVSSNAQKDFCLNKLQPYMIELLKSKQGTHCIQTLLDHMNDDQIQKRFGLLSKQKIYDLSTNKFSMHFIQKLLTLLQNDHLSQTLILLFSKLAVDKQGIVVLKALIAISASNEIKRYQILTACQQCLNQISFTQFGHYVIQQMFLYYSYYQLNNILSYIALYTKFFAQNQYSSSIIRKSIEMYGDYITLPMINQLISVQDQLIQMMENSSGQFVLHRLMELTQNEISKLKLTQKMMQLTSSVKCYEKRQKWMKFFKLI